MTTILQTAEVNYCVLVPQGELGGVGGVETTLPLPKLQNLPQRPTSLHLLHRTNETPSSRLKLGKLKSNHRQVETGVAKMNTVAVATAAEPRQVTAVTFNATTVSRGHSKTALAGGYSAGAPALVTNSLIGRGRTNPAGPQLEDEDKMEAGEDQRTNLLQASREDQRTNLLQASREDQRTNLLQASREDQRTNLLQASREDQRTNLLQASPDEHEPLLSREQPPAESQPGRASNANNNNNRTAGASSEERVQGSGSDPCVRRAPVSTRGSSRSPETRLVRTQTEEALVLDPKALGPPVSDPKALRPPVSVFESLNPQTAALPGPAAVLRRPAFDPQTPQNRRGRPCSLDLSASCISSDEAPLTDDGGLSASGEKIKRRVKTPYTVKKWRPASWVVSTDTALDPDFSSQTHFPSGFQGAGSFGIPKINQSKSSMAVFLVGGGATATATSDPDGITCF
ncbi:hypothetical protein EPR50_G00113890 [Perca flavescens]|uniref:Bone morphogenetic protein receptor type-2 n=1 Tax=Perca flavescens TaxID=8167 RepID=A0A484CSA4_PERFV|nr:hypothetical protein EPR50_G00113890 [Perca flavescens]